MLSFEADAVRKRILTASPVELNALITDAPSALRESSTFDANAEIEEDESRAAVGF